MRRETPFMTINQAAETTGLSRYYLRTGCRNGSIPHVKSGEKFFINVPLLLRQLGVPESDTNAEVSNAGD
jgi:excisionase family DNA binding protein